MSRNVKKQLTAIYVDEAMRGMMLPARILGASDVEPIVVHKREEVLGLAMQLPELNMIVWDNFSKSESLAYCTQLKSNEKTKNIPLIVIAENDQITDEQILATGANEVVRMPFDPDKFQRIIVRYLDLTDG